MTTERKIRLKELAIVALYILSLIATLYISTKQGLYTTESVMFVRNASGDLEPLVCTASLIDYNISRCNIIFIALKCTLLLMVLKLVFRRFSGSLLRFSFSALVIAAFIAIYTLSSSIAISNIPQTNIDSTVVEKYMASPSIKIGDTEYEHYIAPTITDGSIERPNIILPTAPEEFKYVGDNEKGKPIYVLDQSA